MGDNSADKVEGKFAWQTLYPVNESTRVGFEYYAESDDIENPDEGDDHLLGPIAKFSLKDTIPGADAKITVGALAGLSSNAPDATVRWQLSLGF